MYVFAKLWGVAMNADGPESIRNESLIYLGNLIDLVFSSSSLADLCTRLVHSRDLNQAVKGAHIYGLNGDADLLLASGYGYKCDAMPDFISGTSANAAAQSVKSMRPVFANDTDPLLAIPCINNRVPNACLVAVLESASLGEDLNEELLEIVSQAIGFFVSTSPDSGIPTLSRRANMRSKSLTTRQVTILELMSDSLTNAAIARELLVSESTIRQETVKIFRELNVTGRTAAVTRARELNLLNR